MGMHKKSNLIRVENGVAFIELMSHGRTLIALVDELDLPLVVSPSIGRWSALLGHGGRTHYAVARVATPQGIKTQKMHRMILGLDDPTILVDHADCDGLNNRRMNLRVATIAQNGANRRKDDKGTRSSRFKGVSLDKETGRWRARVYLRSGAVSIGSFATETQAALAYDAKLKEIFGDFARSNFEGGAHVSV